jgi:hypothetical protein
MRWHSTSIILGLAAIALVLSVASSGEPVVQPLRGTSVEPALLALGKQNSIVFNLSVGYLVSVMFWLLVVFLPERSRRRLLRSNLERAYRQFKESVLQILLWSSVGMHDSLLPRELCDYRKFTRFFSEEGGSASWYDVANGLQASELRRTELLLEFEIFAQELEYLLNNVNVEDERAHRLLRSLKESIFRLKHSPSDTYDHVKELGRFLWSIFAQWDAATGQLDRDIVQSAIDRI